MSENKKEWWAGLPKELENDIELDSNHSAKQHH